MLRTFLCASAILVTSCGGSGTSAPAAAGGAGRGNATPRAVQVTPAIEARIERAIAVTGTLAAEDQVTMAFKVTGRLEQLDVDLGTSVESGQTLASLASTDFQLRVTQADAALQQARADRLGLATLPLVPGGQGQVRASPALARRMRPVLASTRPRAALAPRLSQKV